jgi:hypothetical protein
MAQLSLRERLQPALFDRLIDDERVVTCYEFAFPRAQLQRLGIPERDLVGILSTQGLRVDEGAEVPASQDVLKLTFTAPAGRVSLCRSSRR